MIRSKCMSECSRIVWVMQNTKYILLSNIPLRLWDVMLGSQMTGGEILVKIPYSAVYTPAWQDEIRHELISRDCQASGDFVVKSSLPQESIVVSISCDARYRGCSSSSRIWWGTGIILPVSVGSSGVVCGHALGTNLMG